MSDKLPRPHLTENGKIRFVSLNKCRRKGEVYPITVDGSVVGYTSGRRRPIGGVCGACGGAIPEERP